jgi:hypothetical protein
MGCRLTTCCRLGQVERDARSALASTLTRSVAEEIALTYGDEVVFPDREVVTRFPSWPTSVLVIAHEHQGVVSWGVPIGDAAPVLVGGHLVEAGEATVAYVGSVREYVELRRWDRACFDSEALLQAQAAPLDADTLAFLRANFDERTTTHGWPAPVNYRFANGNDNDPRIMLWSAHDQCDWWISGADEGSLGGLMGVSDLRTSMWSDNKAGIDLLKRVIRQVG